MLRRVINWEFFIERWKICMCTCIMRKKQRHKCTVTKTTTGCAKNCVQLVWVWAAQCMNDNVDQNLSKHSKPLEMRPLSSKTILHNGQAWPEFVSLSNWIWYAAPLETVRRDRSKSPLKFKIPSHFLPTLLRTRKNEHFLAFFHFLPA